MPLITPSVSLIVPCHNHANSLPRAVSSGLLQTALKEIIVVDDASTDDSLGVALQLEKKDPRIRVVQTAENVGPGGARNLGVREATGAYLSFLDADDELMCDFFHEAIDLMRLYPEMKIIKAEQEFFDPGKGYVLPVSDPRHQSAVLGSVLGLVIKRDVFLKMGGFSEDLAFRGVSGGEDVAFMEAVIKFLQPIGRIERPCYRVWSCNGSHVDRFLANTRLTADSFEFVRLTSDQLPDGSLSQALRKYLAEVELRLGAPEKEPA